MSPSPEAFALAGLRRLWPARSVTVYIGFDNDTQRWAVGFIRSESRKAFRITGATLQEAYDNAVQWTKANPTRRPVDEQPRRADGQAGEAQAEVG